MQAAYASASQNGTLNAGLTYLETSPSMSRRSSAVGGHQLGSPLSSLTSPKARRTSSRLSGSPSPTSCAATDSSSSLMYRIAGTIEPERQLQVAVASPTYGYSSPVSNFRFPRTIEPERPMQVAPSSPSVHSSPMYNFRSPRISEHEKPARVSVIAPGGGTGINGVVYEELGQDPRFKLDIIGRSRAPYDCYPPAFQNGGPPPNLETFANDILSKGILEQTDCLVVGSRGGQVVLPTFWHMQGASVPPAVVINGGVAMGLPTPVVWPDSAVTFLLLGGQDYFRGDFTMDDYLADAKRRVPKANCTTAILYVQEMAHMPQVTLLRTVLPRMIQVVLAWKAGRNDSVSEQMRLLLQALNKAGWSGRLLFKRSFHEWEDIEFPPFAFNNTQRSLQQQQGISGGTGVREVGRPIELTRQDEMRELWKAAANAARPGGGASSRADGARLAAVIQAAGRQAAERRQAKENPSLSMHRVSSRRHSSGSHHAAPAGASMRHRSSTEASLISLSGRQSPSPRSPSAKQFPNARTWKERRMSCPSVLYEVSPASLSPQLAY